MKATAYRIATFNDGQLTVDGAPCRWLPRGRGVSKEVWYLVGRQTWGTLATGLFRVGDTVSGRIRGEPTGGRPIDGPRLCSGDAWGLDPCPELASEQLRRLQDEVGSEGLAFGHSAAATVAPLVAALAPDEQHPLPPRWRRLSHRGMHSGPCAVIRASEPDAIQLDQQQAYLRGLGLRLPVRGSWRSNLRRWQDLRGLDGIVTASVDVPFLGWPIGPLPVDSDGFLGGVSWPFGTVAGTWPIEWLQWAEEHAAITVRAIHDAIVWRADRTMARLQERIAEVRYKPLRRLLYTRAVGRMASSGQWRGTVVEHPRDPKRLAIRWQRTPETPDAGMPAWYRPDVAAIILGETARRTVAAAALYDAALAHVDAVWVPSANVDSVPEGWSVKGRGPLRAYSTGTYTHGEQWGAQGIYGVRSASELAAIVSERRAMPLESVHGRTWEGNPMHDPSATSAPTRLDYDAIRIDPPTWRAGQWSSGGYRRKDAPDERIEAHRADLDGLAVGAICYRDDQREREQIRDAFDVAV